MRNSSAGAQRPLQLRNERCRRGFASRCGGIACWRRCAALPKCVFQPGGGGGAMPVCFFAVPIWVRGCGDVTSFLPGAFFNPRRRFHDRVDHRRPGRGQWTSPERVRMAGVPPHILHAYPSPRLHHLPTYTYGNATQFAQTPPARTSNHHNAASTATSAFASPDSAAASGSRYTRFYNLGSPLQTDPPALSPLSVGSARSASARDGNGEPLPPRRVARLSHYHSSPFVSLGGRRAHRSISVAAASGSGTGSGSGRRM